MSFIKDLLKEKALWWSLAAFATLYLGTLFFSRYYLNPNNGLGGLTSWAGTSQIAVNDMTPTNQATTSPDKILNMTQPPKYSLREGVDYVAKIYTKYGVITVDLFEDYAPNIVNSFVFLAQNNFYNGLYFHRIIPGYLIQTGDPTGTGTGGVRYYVRGDFDPRLPEYAPGIVGMANDGNKDHNGSQFFIVASKADPKVIKEWNSVYPVFGRVISGMNVVDKIASIQIDKNYVPKTKITVSKIEIIEK